MASRVTLAEKVEYCKKTKDSLYEMWKEFVKLDTVLSDDKKEELFNKKFNRIM